MNKVELVGRLTAEPELRYTESDKAYTRFTLAVNRKYKKDDESRDADFISIVAWNKQAEIICQYVKKGNRLGIVGKIQTGSYEKSDGTRGYTYDVIVEDLEFIETKPKDSRPEPEYAEENDPFADYDESIELTDDDLPF